MKIKALFLASALVLCGSAFAQDKNESYQTNGFWDNWFAGIAGGIDYVYDNPSGGGLTPTFDVTVGKWIDPRFGVRAGYEGFKTACKNLDPNKLSNSLLHADFLWNWSNQFGGYKADRVYNFIPYFHADAMFGNGKEIGAGFGLLNNFRLSEKLTLPIDLRGTLIDGEQFGGAGLAGLVSLTAGLTYNFGVSTFKSVSEAVAPALAAAAAAEAAKNALQSEKDKLAAANKAANDKADKLASENANLKDEVAKGLSDNSDLIKGLLETPMVAYFEIGQAKLSKKELAHVDYIVKNIMSRGKNAKFTLSGNADSKTGSKKRNQQLSEQRADYLFKLLTEKYGMSADQFTVKANGGNDVFDTPELNRAVIIEAE